MRAHALLLVGVLGLTAYAQDTYTLKWEPKVGDTSSYNLNMTSAMDFGGQSFDMNISMVVSDKVTKVEGDQVTLVGSATNFKMMMNGQEFNPPGSEAAPQQPPTTLVVSKSGGLIRIEKAGDGMGSTPPRVEQANRFQFPAGPVKVGDEWFREVKADAKEGFVAAKAKYTLEKVEVKDGVNSFRIKYAYSELEGNAPTDCIGTFWMAVEDGDLVRYEGQLNNVEFMEGMPPVSAKIVLTQVTAN